MFNMSKKKTYSNVGQYCPIRCTLIHRQLICVLWELGAVVIGILNDNSNCCSGFEVSFFLIYGNHLHQHISTEEPPCLVKCLKIHKYANEKIKMSLTHIISDSKTVLNFSYLYNHLLYFFEVHYFWLLDQKLNSASGQGRLRLHRKHTLVCPFCD